jgi:TonB family protein
MRFYGKLLVAAILLLMQPGQAVSQSGTQASSAFTDEHGGVPEDSVSLDGIREAAEKGSPSAQLSLGMIYYRGSGVAQDYAKAAEWFRKSLEQGNATARYMMGGMYLKGQGVPQDSVQAYMWLTFACEGSAPGQASPAGTVQVKALQLRNSLEKTMTPQQLEEARKLIKERKPFSLEAPKRIGANILKSKLIKRVEPLYPDAAKQANQQGTVIMVITVDEWGNVANVDVKQGDSLLASAAVEAVKQWKYNPTILDCVPIPVTSTVTVAFRMQQ